MQKDPKLAEAANQTWTLACDIHDRQTRVDSNVNGRKHVEKVEENIFRLLFETNDKTPERNKNIDRFSAVDLYLLSCAACCHDFDKGLHNQILPEDYKHGEGSGDFVFRNWQSLAIKSEAAAEYIDCIIRIHDCKSDFDEELQKLPDIYTLFNNTGQLQMLATILKAADTLHLDESRISTLAAPTENLSGFDKLKQMSRANIRGWSPDGRRITITASIKNPESAKALQECEKYIKLNEWPPISRNLNAYQFPHILHFDWDYPRTLRNELLKVGLVTPKGAIADFEKIDLDLTSAALSSTELLIPKEPLCLTAVPPDELAEYLSKIGFLSVIDNVYIRPELHDKGTSPGPISRIFIGPANCGKTRAAYEWIKKKVGLDSHAWVIIRPESGSIPQDAAKFQIDFEKFYDSRNNPIPPKAILFVDDLPDYLPPPGTGPAASESVHRLLEWFRLYPGIQERFFVGTIRLERMHDKPGWPEELAKFGKLRLLQVEPLDAVSRRKLWEGMTKGRTFQKGVFKKLDLQIDEAFFNAVANLEADPESIAYYIRAMFEHGKNHIKKEDAKSFSADAAKIWADLTWPTIFDTYGPSANVFYTIARFIEGGSRQKSGFIGNLSPSWEYHAIFGPPLLEKIGGQGDCYIAVLDRILKDGHASGIAGEIIRPKFDFLLQARELLDIELHLPEVSWFVRHSDHLSPNGQVSISFHLSCAGRLALDDSMNPYWLYGYGAAMGYLATNETDTSLKRNEDAIKAYNELVRRFGDDETPAVREKVATGMVNKGDVLVDLKREEDAIKAFDEVVRRFGNDEVPAVREKVARGMVNKGVGLGRLKREEEEIKVYDEVVRRFGDDGAPAVREKVAIGMHNKAGVLSQLKRDEDAIKAYDEMVRRFGDDEAPAIREKVAIGMRNKGVVLGRLKREEDAIKAYDELVRRFGDDETPAVREEVAKGMVNKGFVQERLKCEEDAIKAYDEVVRRFGDDEAPAVRDKVASGLVNKGIFLRRLKRDEDAIKAYDELVCRFGDDEAPAVREQVASGMVSKGVFMFHLRREEDAIRAFDEMVCRFGDDEAPAVREEVALGMRNKGDVLVHLKREEDAIKAFDEVVRHFGDDEEPAVREQVATGMVNKGVVLGRLKRDEDAIKAFDEVVRRFGDDEEPAVREPVATGMVYKGVVLGRLKREEEAIKAFDEVGRRFGEDEAPAVLEQVAKGMVNKGIVLGRLKREEDAIKAYDEVVRRFGDDEAPTVRQEVAIGMRHKGLVLGRLKREEDAIKAFDEMVRRFGDDETPAVREEVARGMVNKGFGLSRLKREEDAIKAYDELVCRFGEDEAPAVREQVATGMVNKGVILGRLKREEDAIKTFDKVVRRFGNDEAPAVQEKVAAGMDSKIAVLSKLGRLREAVALGKKVIEIDDRCYNLACVLCLSGETDDALKYLKRSLADNKISWSHVDKDPDLTRLHGRPEYEKLKKKYKNSNLENDKK